MRLVRLQPGRCCCTGEAGVNDMSRPGGHRVHHHATGGRAVRKRCGGRCRTSLYLAALIAVNLAVMNLLPLPALDGGRIFFLL